MMFEEYLNSMMVKSENRTRLRCKGGNMVVKRGGAKILHNSFFFFFFFAHAEIIWNNNAIQLNGKTLFMRDWITEGFIRAGKVDLPW